MVLDCNGTAAGCGGDTVAGDGGGGDGFVTGTGAVAGSGCGWTLVYDDTGVGSLVPLPPNHGGSLLLLGFTPENIYT